MKIPSHIDICGIDYKVVIKPSDDWDGKIESREQTIYLASGMTGQRTAQTLVHEAIHGILDELGYEELSSDEKLVSGLAAGLHGAFFRKNLKK